MPIPDLELERYRMVDTASELGAAASGYGREPGTLELGAPLISVIIPHFNDLANLRICLDVLKAQTIERSTFEVVVADNLSDCGLDAVRKVAGDFALVVLAAAPGPGPARNAGVAATRGEILAFTDTDCRPAETWLEEGVKTLKGFDIVGGAMRVTTKSPENPTAVECFEKVFAFNNRRYVKKDGFTVTANMLTRRAVFAKVGGFAETETWEDIEWCERARSAGYRLGYADLAVVSHPARYDWPQLVKKFERILRHSYRQNEELGRGQFHWFLYCCVVLISPLRHIFVVLCSDQLQTWPQRMGAIQILLRSRAWRFVEGLRLMTNKVEKDPWGRVRAKS